MCYIVAIAGATIISFHDAAKTATRGECELAKARFGNDWQWGDTLDDRRTLRMLRYLNRNGSSYSKMFCPRD
jgi:hypothetical protein